MQQPVYGKGCLVDQRNSDFDKTARMGFKWADIGEMEYVTVTSQVVESSGEAGGGNDYAEHLREGS